jgi:WD40 repeat protein
MKKTFISYSRKDQDFAFKLVGDLKKHGHDVFLDQTDIQPGQPWDIAIEQALLDCQTVVVVVSPDSMASENVQDEINYAISDGKDIVPILIREARMGIRIARKQAIDFRKYEDGLIALMKRLPAPDEQKAKATLSVSQQQVNTSGKTIKSSTMNKLQVLANVDFDEKVALWGNAIHPSKDILMFGGIGGALHMWDVVEGRVTQVGNFSSIYNLRFSPDANYVIISGEDGEVSILGLQPESSTYEIRAKLSGHLATVFGSVVNYQNNLIATCGEDETLRVFSIEGNLKHEHVFDFGQLFGIDFAKHENFLYCTGECKHVIKYDAVGGKVLETWLASDYTLYGVVVSPQEDNLVATCGVDRTVKLWHDGQLKKTLSGHGGSTMWISFHPTEPIIAVACYDNTVWLWDIEKGTTLLVLRETKPVYNTAFNAAGNLLITTTTSGVIIRGVDA